jgi:putative SOS response-associated peptidase YedK
MCYDAESATLLALKYAEHRGDIHTAEELRALLEEIILTRGPKYHTSGFEHAELIAFTNEAPYKPVALKWGLIPAWTKSLADAMKIRTQTLNAKGETIFEKPSFRNSAKNKRCLIYLDAFYEHHHANKQTYPFRIAMKDGSPMAVAGLWEEWVDKQTGEIFRTATIVTTTGNELMSKIHNNPNAEMGPRMPVILLKEQQDEWLMDCRSEVDKQRLISLIKPLENGLLKAYTVGRLRGKSAVGNVPEIEKEVIYPELSLTTADC